MSPWVMSVFNLAEAKAHLSELVAAAARGEDITIARRNVPLVRLAPIRKVPRKPRFGILRGKVHVAEDFDAPLEEFRRHRR